MESNNSPLIYVVDDDEMIVNAVGATLASVGYSYRGYSNAETFLAEVDDRRTGCVLMDVMMPHMDGLQVQAELQRRHCMLPLIFISGQADLAVAVSAMKQGAFDYIEKPPRAHALIDVVNRALKLSSERGSDRDRLAGVRERLSWLTPRERDVLVRLAAGDANRTIAEQLGLSARTVEVHRSNVMGKMGAQSLAELVRMCLELGLA